MSLSDEQLTELGVLARAGEADARLPDAAVAVLRDAGLLRLAVAGRFGGEDRSLREILSVVGRLSRVDGALGWSCGQVALSQIMLGYLPEEAQERIYASGPDVYAAGAAAPKGRASRRAAGWSVSGRWPLVSGAAHAEWLFLHCLQADGARPLTDRNGAPRLRMVVLPAGRVTIHDTWDALGLRATGSHDVAVRAAECEDPFTAVLSERPSGSALCAWIDPRLIGGLFVAEAALGIAHGGLQGVIEVARNGKRGSFSNLPLAEQPVFQQRLGDALVSLRAGESLLTAELARAERRCARGPLNPLDGARLRAAAVGAVRLGLEATRTAFALGGSAALRTGSPISRALRDAETASLHFAVGRDHYAQLGAELVASASA
jgi:alkylation response protein AidB-like acyl-CoA dehydrogenase